MDRKIRERKSLGSGRPDFKFEDHFVWISNWQAEKKVCFAELQMQKWIAFQFCLEESCAFLLKYFWIHIRFEHTFVWLKAFGRSL